jgi:glutamine synthetase adenylyltransferase
MKEMRKKLYPSDLGGKLSLSNLKKSSGGLIDVEFIVQYFALLSGDNFSLAAGKGVNAVTAFSEVQISKDDSKSLLQNYGFLKRLDLLNQVIFHTSTSLLPSDKKKLTMLAKQMQFESVESFQNFLNEVMKSNKFLYQKYMAVN